MVAAYLAADSVGRCSQLQAAGCGLFIDVEHCNFWLFMNDSYDARQLHAGRLGSCSKHPHAGHDAEPCAPYSTECLLTYHSCQKYRCFGAEGCSNKGQGPVCSVVDCQCMRCSSLALPVHTGWLGFSRHPDSGHDAEPCNHGAVLRHLCLKSSTEGRTADI